MDIITDATLIEKIEAFISEHEIKPSRFGLAAMGDGALLPQLKAGRSLSLKNAERVLNFMATYRPATAQGQAAA